MISYIYIYIFYYSEENKYLLYQSHSQYHVVYDNKYLLLGDYVGALR